MVTGIRSLCSGFGPALFGTLFQIAQVPLGEDKSQYQLLHTSVTTPFPGSPFLVGTGFVLIALFVTMNAPDRLGRKLDATGEHSSKLYERTNVIELNSSFANSLNGGEHCEKGVGLGRR